MGRSAGTSSGIIIYALYTNNGHRLLARYFGSAPDSQQPVVARDSKSHADDMDMVAFPACAQDGSVLVVY